MRFTQTCPKCSGRRFAVTDEFRVPKQEWPDSTKPFPAITIEVHESGRHATTLGTFETWICMGCGYTEFYAKSLWLAELQELAARNADRLRVVDAGAREQGPYR